jgi:EmrB/QacA subfamily drug resistance transporter
MTSVAEPLAGDDAAVSLFGRMVAYKNVVAIVYITALFLDILDVTIVNVAIPALGRELHSNNAEWVILGYTLSLAVWIPASGWLGDRIGTKKTFMFAFIAFTLGSLLCASADTMGQLIAYRVIQGIGGGMLTPVGVAMLFRAFPPSERARASTIVMVPAMLAPAMGPILGGLLVTHANWRWIFIVNVPIGIVGILFGFKFLREHKEPTAGSFDLPGFLLSGAALAMIVYALSDGPQSGWTSTPVIATAGLGIICAVLVVWVEGRVERPMLDLRLLHNRLFRQCNVFSLLSSMSFLGLTFVMPLYLQLFRGLDAFESGLTTFPQAIGILVAGQIAGRLYMRLGPRRLMAGGLFCAGLVILSFVSLDSTTSLWEIRGQMFLRGVCMGFAFVPMQAASYATIESKDNGRASSIFSAQRQVGVSLGVAILASVLASFMPLATTPTDLDRALDGYHLAFALAVLFAWAAAISALFIRDSDAAATMRPRAGAMEVSP